jgi:DNA-binding MarR family transcriptional regulator
MMNETCLDRTLRGFVGYNIKRSYLLIREAALEVLQPHGLRPTSFSALVIVSDNAGLTQSQLANALQVKRPGVVQIVDELEKLELITRNPVPGDRRSYALRTTRQGMRVRKQAVQQLEKRESELLCSLNQQEKTLLTQLFTKIDDNQADTPALQHAEVRR